jgi:parallel beta-helix repeat protein
VLVFLAGFLGFITTEPDQVRGTDVSGTIFDGSGGPWTLAGSPYIVIGDVTVPTGETLTIEPGVEARFDYFIALNVGGSLVAVGTQISKIIMTSNSPTPEDDNWEGIVVNSTGHVDIEYCELSYAYAAVYVDSSDGNNITKSYMTGNRYSARLEWSNNNQIVANNISNEGGRMYLYHADNNVISDNEFYYNEGSMMFFEYADYNTVTNNTIAHDKAGIHFTWSDHNNVSDNTFIDSGIFLSHGRLSDFTTHTMQNNTVNGKPLRYIKECAGVTVDGESVGQVIFADCDNVIVRNLQIDNTYGAVQLLYTTNSIVESVSISNVSTGMYLEKSERNIIRGNNISLAGMAMHIHGSLDNTIESNEIVGNKRGIYTDLWSDRNTYANNTVSNNDLEGIEIYYESEDNIVRNNTIEHNRAGIVLKYGTRGSIVEGNTISNNERAGISLSDSEYNIIEDNELLNDGFYVWGTQLSHFNTHIMPENNTVNGKPLYYWKNCSDLSVDGESLGQLILVNCTNVDVRNLQLGNSYVGMEFAYSTGINITNNYVSNARYGISLHRASGNEITLNRIDTATYGIYALLSSNNITSNNVSHNGIGLDVQYSSLNNITQNDLWNNSKAINIYDGSSNIVYHNNFYFNENTPSEFPKSNFWNSSYPTGGNYWSDYVGVDQLRGPNQDIPGPDGISDTPYIFRTNSQDNYPLMAPFGTDVVPPMVTITSPTDGSTLTSSPATMTGTASDIGGSGLERVTVNVNDGVWSDATGTSSWTASVDLVPGLNTLKAQAWDNAGYSSAIDSVTVTYDPPGNDPPVASFTVSPTSGGFSTLFEVNASASSDMEDPSSDLEVRWDWEYDGIWDTDWSTVKTAQHQYPIPAVFIIPTVYTILMEVRDTSGLVANTSLQLMIDDFPPICSITSPNQGETLSGTASIVGAATFYVGNVTDVEVRIDGGSWMPTVGNLSWIYTWDTTGVSNGEHVIHARAYDGEQYSDTVNATVIVNNPISDGQDDWLFVAVAVSIIIIVVVMLLYIFLKRRRTKGEEESIEPILEESS